MVGGWGVGGRRVSKNNKHSSKGYKERSKSGVAGWWLGEGGVGGLGGPDGFGTVRLAPLPCGSHVTPLNARETDRSGELQAHSFWNRRATVCLLHANQ